MNKRLMKEFIYDGAAIVGQVEQQEQPNDLEKEMRRLIREKEVFVVKISGTSEDSVSANVLGEYMGIIPKKEVSNRTYIRRNISNFIGQNVPVIMKHFDLETKTCKLSRTFAVNQLKGDFLNEIVPKIEEINKDDLNYKKYIKSFEINLDPHFNDYPRVKAKVIQFDAEKHRVMLNIAGLDLMGMMDVGMLDHKFVYNPEAYIDKYFKPNTVIEVALLAFYENRKEGHTEMFIASRKHAIPDPWKGVEKKIRPGDVIIVKALEKRDNHFFGEYDNFQLDIRCFYPNSPDRELLPGELYGRRLVTTGKEYKVEILKVKENRCVLTAKFIEEL
ncbi:MAG: hypothetical protein JEZ08_16435 [Clostridiales bacterium]|nr:hypothetical protein [Clostridiales bacterium]